MSTSDDGAPAGRRPWPMLGRDRELELADRALRDPASSGVLVTGPFGTGRSRLAQECWRAAGRRGHPRLHAAATPAARYVPLGALAPVLRRGPDGAPGLLEDEVRAVRPRPVLFLDDAHHLDSASARLVAESTRNGRLLVVATSALHARLPWEEHPRRQALLPVRLEALPVQAMGRLLRHALGGPVERRTVRLLHRATGGRPRELEEVLEGAVAEAALRWDGTVWRLTGALPVTAGLRALTDSRLRSLDPRDREFLDRVAVCGRLAHVRPAQADVEGLVLDGWLRARTEGSRTFLELAGDLHRQLLCARLPSQRTRRILRQELARSPESGSGDLLDRARWRSAAGEPFDPYDLTAAVRAARSVPDHDLALRLARELVHLRPGPASGLALAEQLLEGGRPHEARAAVRQVLRDSAAPDERARATVLEAQRLLGDLRGEEGLSAIATARDDCAADPGAAALLDAAEAALRSLLGDMEGAGRALGPGPVRAAGITEPLHLLAEIRCRTESGRTKEAVGLLRHAPEGAAPLTRSAARQATVAEAEPSVRFVPAGTEAWALAEAGALEEAGVLAERAYDRAVDARAVRSLTSLAEQLGWIRYLQGRLDECRTWYATALGHGREAGQRSSAYAGLCGLALVAAVCADVTGAEQWREQARSLAPRSGWRAEPVLADAWLAAATGRLGEARRQLRRAADEAARRGLHTAQALLWCDVARLGDAQAAAGALSRLAACSDSALTAARAGFARALASAEPGRLETCAAGLERLGVRLLAAEAWTAAAAAHARAGARPSAAGAALDRAARLTCREAAARTPALVAPRARLGLTARETEVALAAASGLGVEETARRLSLADRTVVNHLRRIRSKLGVTDTGRLRTALFPDPRPAGP
ncbi:LuxR C-terminal-related transcriptional regulator [Streptomyces sp. AHA2]|uniref:LuxR C-terminal-related transcriptional regulator n=1 Tax=Streptomyces sp. AHA2 TaxID=3064526 RepID=UPI002FE00CE5